MATTLNEEARIILTKAKKHLTAKQIYKEIEKRGNLKLRTKTPVASLNSELYMDMKKNGNQSKFVKIEKLSDKGKFEKYYSINKIRL